MSRQTYAAPREAQERWPELSAFISSSVHGDDDVPVEEDVDRCIASYDLKKRQTLIREWWNWNATAEAVNDIRFAIEALDGNVLFGDADHARKFMNACYEKLITSVRREVGKDWKP